MEGVVLEHFNEFQPSTIPMTQLHYHLSDESDEDVRNTSMHIFIFFDLLFLNCLDIH